MAAAFVSQTDGVAIGGGTTVSATAFNNTLGNLLWLVLQTTAGITTSAIADTAGNTWTQCTDHSPFTATSGTFNAWWYAKNIKTQTNNVVTATFNGSPGAAVIYVAQYSGLDTVAPFDKSMVGDQTAPGTGTNAVTSGTLTPASQPGMFIGFCSNQTAGAGPTASAGFTARTQVWNVIGSTEATPEDVRLTATSAKAATWTVASGQGASEHVSVAAFFLEPSSNVTVGLTGLAITSGQGTLSPSNSVGLTGQAITSGQGSLTAAIAAVLSGLSVTSGQGTIGVDIQIPLSGLGITSGFGTLSPQTGGDVTVALTGLSITSSQGSLGPNNSVPLTGLLTTSGQGSLIPALAKALTGLAITAAKGTVSPSLTIILNGQVIVSARGTLTPSGGTPVTGGALPQVVNLGLSLSRMGGKQ